MSLFCENCGAKLAEDAKFCEECGTKILPASQVPPPSHQEAETSFNRNQQPMDTDSFGSEPQYQKQNYRQQEPFSHQPETFNNNYQNGAQTQGYRNPEQQPEQYAGQNIGKNQGYAPAPAKPKKSGFPKVAIIGIVALVAAAAAGAFLIAGKIKGGQEEDESVPDEFYANYDQPSSQTQQSTQTASVEKSDSPGRVSAREQASALDAALNTEDVDTNMLGQKAKEIAGKHGNDSSDSGKNSLTSMAGFSYVTGGKWIQVAATWLYEKDNEIVKNSWIQTDGSYYYVDENGYMLEDTYTPDGYYVGPDGAYDPNAFDISPNSSRTYEEFLPSTFAKKGKRDILQDGTVMYMNSIGDYVANVWVEDGGKYYYTGPDGSMIKNNYSADGYWCGSDGAWDKSVKQRLEDPEPMTGTYEGFVTTWKVKITKDSNYGTATSTYTSFGGTPKVYDLTPLGHGVYLAEEDSGFMALMSVMDNGKTLVVSEAGITEECTLK